MTWGSEHRLRLILDTPRLTVEQGLETVGSARVSIWLKRANKYAERPTDSAMYERIAALRTSGHSIADTARLTRCTGLSPVN